MDIDILGIDLACVMIVLTKTDYGNTIKTKCQSRI